MDKTAKIRMKAKRNVTDLAGEKVMVDFEQGKYFCIKGVGNDIWDMLDGQEGEDGITVEAILHKLMEEYTETGRTFVISTHIIEEAADLMEEVIMIKDGSLLLKENTQDLLERSYHVSGLAEVVDQAAEGYEKHHEEKMGRSKSVTILLKEGQELPKGYDVTIQPISLEKLFVSLCGLDD